MPMLSKLEEDVLLLLLVPIGSLCACPHAVVDGHAVAVLDHAEESTGGAAIVGLGAARAEHESTGTRTGRAPGPWERLVR